MKNTARYAIGMTVLMMDGAIENYESYIDNRYYGHPSDQYWRILSALKDWKIHKRYWSTKKNYAFCDKMTMFGETRSEIIDVWLTTGFELEKKLNKILLRLEPMARH